MQMAEIMTDELSQNEQALLNRWKKNKKFSLSDAVKDELRIKFSGEILFDEAMSRHTYIRIGGKADAFLRPKNTDDIITALRIAQKYNIPCTFHGSGANTLVRDGGIRGLVISACDTLKEFRILQNTEQYIDVEAEAGLGFARLVHLSKDHGSMSLASFIGIPGCVGGLVSMNAGTRDREIRDVLRSVTVLNRDLFIEEISRENLEFEYRKLKLPRTSFILKAVFRLEKNSDHDTVDAEIKRCQKRRQDTQPLNYPNLGSIFKNPVPQTGLPHFFAGQLVEEAGVKDVRVGGARISPKHANFIVNEGNATAADVLALIGLAKDRVKATSGVELETEIKIIGEDQQEQG